MAEIEFSVMVSNLDYPLDKLRGILDMFEEQYHHTVHLTPIAWGTGWAEVIKFGLYGQGPDVSEVGTTWLGSIAAMNALRPFTPQEVENLGGADAFVESCWKSCTFQGENIAWSIPWQADTRILYYRADWLDRVGISDHQAAFADHRALVETLSKLRESGVSSPLSLVVQRNFNSIYESASWIWGANGHFVEPDGSRVLLDKPEALVGLRNYFGLRRYFGQVDPRALNPWESFSDGQTAVTVSGPLLMAEERDKNPALAEKWGISLTPGVPFVGGTNLLVWKHTRQSEAAIELVNFLTRQKAKFPYMAHNGLLPARRSLLDDLKSDGDSFIETCIQSLEAGRTLTNRRVWGYLEDKLLLVFPQIWKELIEDPYANIGGVVDKNILPFVRRVNASFQK